MTLNFTNSGTGENWNSYFLDDVAPTYSLAQPATTQEGELVLYSGTGSAVVRGGSLINEEKNKYKKMNLHVYLGLSLLLLTFNAGSTVLNQAADAQGDFSPYVSAATTEFIKLVVAALLLSKDW